MPAKPNSSSRAVRDAQHRSNKSRVRWGEIAARRLLPSTFSRVSFWVVYAYSVSMTESDSERFLREAEDCRQMAARATNPQAHGSGLPMIGLALQKSRTSKTRAREPYARIIYRPQHGMFREKDQTLKPDQREGHCNPLRCRCLADRYGLTCMRRGRSQRPRLRIQNSLTSL
jgi:hypothetical protein